MTGVRVGDVLAGKYRVDRVLGQGGMGVVVAATHLQLDERVALKFMLPEAASNAEVAARFQREARAAVKLKSEHVARVHDVGTLEGGAPYIVMEFLEGSDLANLLAQHGQLPVEEAADYALQACDAIAEAHSLGIIHRDLKPANLFVARRGDGTPLVKVLDFGISKTNALSDSGVSMTKSSSVMGSPLYMSPEQMKSSRDVDARSDVWSIGVLLYEAVCGRVPFEGENVGALMAKVLTEAPPHVRSVRQDVPEAFAALVMKCLEKEPSSRCASVAEVADELAPFAPARTRLLADRISGVLGRPRVSSGPPVAPTVAMTSLKEPGAATAASWATASGIPRRRGGRIAAIAIGAAVVVGGGVFAVLRVIREAHDPTSAASSASSAPMIAPSALAAAATPPPIATLVPPADSAPSASATSTQRRPPPTPISKPAPAPSAAPPPATTSVAPPPPPPPPPPPAPTLTQKKDPLKDWN